jgi:peptide-methionine (S)-S-oxide reductase
VITRFINLKIFIICTFLLCSNFVYAQNFKTVYFAGGCFWCMEESFEKIDGVLEVVSGYSGGTTENPTYKEVTVGNTGHFETIEVKYNFDKVSYKELLDIFWRNIDPFDAQGQFCDKGYSYRSVAFYRLENEKDLIDSSIKVLEKKFNKKIVTYVKKFKKFYKAESYHQDYYKKSFVNYLMYKKSCGRVKTLKGIWN